jgi:enoyl-CoA hydratase
LEIGRRFSLEDVMHTSVIRVEREGGRALVTINRPEVLNALNAATLAELQRVAEELEGDGGVRAVVITGAAGTGRSQAFVAGADIAELVDLDAAGAARFGALGQETMARIEGLGKPVIAAVNGYALGGGCELALACDLIFAAETARFGLPEVNLGILPGWGGTQRLPGRVGIGKAKEMLFSGAPIDAAKALRFGLADRVYPDSALLSEALAFADQLATKSPAALRHAKSALQGGIGLDRAAGCALELREFAAAFATAERKAAMKAFLERKKR